MKLFPRVCVLFNFLCDVVIPVAVVFQDQSTSALALSMILLCHCGHCHQLLEVQILEQRFHHLEVCPSATFHQ